MNYKRRVLRLQTTAAATADSPAAAAGAGAERRELTVHMAVRPPAAAAAAADPSVGGAMLRQLIVLAAQLRPHVSAVRARNDGAAAARRAREQALAEETEKVRRVEQEMMEDFLPLYRAKKRRLAQRQAGLAEKGIVVPSSSSPSSLEAAGPADDVAGPSQPPTERLLKQEY